MDYPVTTNRVGNVGVRLLSTLRRRRGIEGVSGQASVYNVPGDVDEPAVVIASMAAQLAERLVHVDAHAFGQHALGLLDDDSAVEGVAELFVDDLGLRAPITAPRSRIGSACTDA
jgi:hypothetical protein